MVTHATSIAENSPLLGILNHQPLMQPLRHGATKSKSTDFKKLDMQSSTIEILQPSASQHGIFIAIVKNVQNKDLYPPQKKISFESSLALGRMYLQRNFAKELLLLNRQDMCKSMR